MAMWTAVAPGERVLWRGAPVASLVVRRWATGNAVSVVMSGLGVAATLGMVTAASGSTVVLPFVAVVLLLPTVGWLPLAAIRVRRRARATSYTLTERRVVIESPAGRTDLRLANLPDLRMERNRDGSGTISFTMPAGGGPERYLERLSRALMLRAEPTELIASVPQVQHVFDLMRAAQAAGAVPDSVPAGSLPGSQEAADAAPRPRPSVARDEAPVTRLSFTESAAEVPLWFGGVFLVCGLGVMAIAVMGGLTRGGLPLFGLGCFFALVGGALVRGRLRYVGTRERLRALGRPASGEVVDIAATGIRDNEQEQWVIRYRYEVGGRSFTGHSPPIPWTQAARFAAGDRIGVVVDPADPSRSILADLDV